jgi:hypothetical protein
MSSFEVLNDIGNTLAAMIKNEAAGLETVTPFPEALLETPSRKHSDQQNPNTLSLFLFQISENTYLKNEDARNFNSSPEGTLRFPPLALDLLYLVTVISDSDDHEKRILGTIMQIFHNNPVIPPKYFQGVLKGTNEEIRITFHSFSIDDLTKIWNTFEESQYRLSVGYMVSPVFIDSNPVEASRRVEAWSTVTAQIVPRGVD